MSIVLWIAQGLLAALFLFAGGVKLVLPPEALAGSVPMPILFLRFIGICEVLGALGLILPMALKIRTALTPLAAAGLVIIMIGATIVTLMEGMVAPALVPFASGLVAAVVAHGRWSLVTNRKDSESHARFDYQTKAAKAR
jgi:hypothetical protein